MRNINVMQESSVGPALSINSDMRKDVHDVFMAKEGVLLSLTNVRTANERGQSSVDIGRVNHHVVNMEKISSRLLERREQICDHPWRNEAILRNNVTVIHNEAMQHHK